MRRTTIPANRLPRQASSGFFSNITLSYLFELGAYFRDEFYRFFYFITDLLSLIAGL